MEPIRSRYLEFESYIMEDKSENEPYFAEEKKGTTIYYIHFVWRQTFFDTIFGEQKNGNQ